MSARRPVGETYTEEFVTNILDCFDQLAAVFDASRELTHYENLSQHHEMLWCLFVDMKQAINLLPRRQRRAVMLYYVFGMTQDEAAQILHISRFALICRCRKGVRAVTSMLNNGKHPLRQRGTTTPLRAEVRA